MINRERIEDDLKQIGTLIDEAKGRDLEFVREQLSKMRAIVDRATKEDEGFQKLTNSEPKKPGRRN